MSTESLPEVGRPRPRPRSRVLLDGRRAVRRRSDVVVDGDRLRRARSEVRRACRRSTGSPRRRCSRPRRSSRRSAASRPCRSGHVVGVREAAVVHGERERLRARRPPSPSRVERLGHRELDVLVDGRVRRVARVVAGVRVDRAGRRDRRGVREIACRCRPSRRASRAPCTSCSRRPRGRRARCTSRPGRPPSSRPRSRSSGTSGRVGSVSVTVVAARVVRRAGVVHGQRVVEAGRVARGRGRRRRSSRPTGRPRCRRSSSCVDVLLPGFGSVGRRGDRRRVARSRSPAASTRSTVAVIMTSTDSPGVERAEVDRARPRGRRRAAGARVDAVLRRRSGACRACRCTVDVLRIRRAGVRDA